MGTSNIAPVRDRLGSGAAANPWVRLGPRRGVVLSFADQVVSSTSNFITGVAIARLAGAVEFGEYTLVLTIWLIVVGVHRRVITEPMIVESRDADTEDSPIADGLAAELLLGALASLLVATGGIAATVAGEDIGRMLLAMSPWFVPLLVQDYWRAIAYQRRRPDLALINDVAFAMAQLAAIGAFAVAGWRTGGHMIGAWGLGATVGAALGSRWFRTRATWRDGTQLLARLWPRSRWLLADFVTVFAVQQGYLVAAAFFLSKVDYGGFRAGYSLMGPTMVILLAAGNIGLPEAARRAAAADRGELRRYVRQLSFWTSTSVALYGVGLAVAARPLLRVLYGPAFVRFAPLTVLVAFQYMVLVSVYGQGLALRATGWVSRLWPARFAIVAGSLVSLVLLHKWLGLAGVGWAGVATATYDTVAVYLVYRWSLRDDARASVDAGRPLPP